MGRWFFYWNRKKNAMSHNSEIIGPYLPHLLLTSRNVYIWCLCRICDAANEALHLFTEKNQAVLSFLHNLWWPIEQFIDLMSRRHIYRYKTISTHNPFSICLFFVWIDRASANWCVLKFTTIKQKLCTKYTATLFLTAGDSNGGCCACKCFVQFGR